MSNTLSENIQSELKTSIAKTLLGEARKNELIITKVRLMVLALVAFLDYFYYMQPVGLERTYAFNISNFYLAILWFCISLVVYIALRTDWYRTWLHIFLPVMDGLIVFSLFVNVFINAETIGSSLPAASNSTIACAVLAVTGALRFNRSAPWITTSLAILTAATIAYLMKSPLLETLFILGLLLGIGLLGMRMSSVVRSSVESEVARLVLDKFLPEEIVNNAHTSPLTTIAEPRRLNATVIVTDIRGFTAFSESLAPEDVLKHLNIIQGALADVVYKNGGRVDKFMGDGMLAVFGDSGQDYNHAYLGIKTSLALLDAIQRLNSKHNIDIRLGVGVHSGPIVVGCLGSGKRLEFTIIGDTVNTASRLESLTKEKNVDILISDETRLVASNSEVFDNSSVESLGQVNIRGKQLTLEIFTINTL